MHAPTDAILHVDLAGVAYSLDAFDGEIASGGTGASFIGGTDLLVDGGTIAAVRTGAVQMPTA